MYRIWIVPVNDTFFGLLGLFVVVLTVRAYFSDLIFEIDIV